MRLAVQRARQSAKCIFRDLQRIYFFCPTAAAAAEIYSTHNDDGEQWSNISGKKRGRKVEQGRERDRGKNCIHTSHRKSEEIKMGKEKRLGNCTLTQHDGI